MSSSESAGNDGVTGLLRSMSVSGKRGVSYSLRASGPQATMRHRWLGEVSSVLSRKESVCVAQILMEAVLDRV